MNQKYSLCPATVIIIYRYLYSIRRINIKHKVTHLQFISLHYMQKDKKLLTASRPLKSNDSFGGRTRRPAKFYAFSGIFLSSMYDNTIYSKL